MFQDLWRWFADPSPVNPVAAMILVACYVPFGVRLIWLRRQSAENPGGERRDWISFGGIVLQGVGFFIVFSPPYRQQQTFEFAGSAMQAWGPGVLALTAVLIFEFAARELGRNWSFVARVRDDHRLVTSGIFSIVRNPIYLAMLCMMMAAGLALGHDKKLLAAVPVFMVGTSLRILREEALLRSQFGVDYDAYAKRVARMIPGVW